MATTTTTAPQSAPAAACRRGPAQGGHVPRRLVGPSPWGRMTAAVLLPVHILIQASWGPWASSPR